MNYNRTTPRTHLGPKRLIAIGITCVVLVAACGGDDDTGDTPNAEGSAAPSADTTPETTESAPNTTEPPSSTEPSPPESSPPTTDTAVAVFPVTIEHALGSTEIPEIPKRIVSASATMTGHPLAIAAPVVAAQVVPPQSPLADENGFLIQWGDVAAAAGVTPIAGPEVNIEAIAAAQPDLIVGNSFGGDAITDDVYALLSQIAPTIVIDHSGMQWQELSVILGEATGLQAEAEVATDGFDAHVANIASALDTTYPAIVGVFTPEGVNVFTSESSHGKLLESLGLTVISPDGGNLEGEAGAGTRADVVTVSPELIVEEFGDASVFFVFAEQEDIEQALDLYPTLAATPAATEGRMTPLGIESFRLDMYSATSVVDRIAAALG